MMDRRSHANRAPRAVFPDKRATVVEPTSPFQASSVHRQGSGSCSEKSELRSNRESLHEMDSSQQSDLDGSNNTVSTDFSSCCVSTSASKQVRFVDDDDDDAIRTTQQQEQPHTVIAYLPLPHEMESEQRNALWWSERDYANFSDTAKNIARQVRQHPALTSGLEEAYLQAEVVSSKVDSVQDADPYLDSMVFDSGLALWCAHGHSRRGLERSGSALHSCRRFERARRLHRAIVDESKQGVDDEELRRISEQQTLLPKLMARMLGEADAAAVQTLGNTFMRRWSDLGSTSTTTLSPDVPGGTATINGRGTCTRRVRTGSLPQDSTQWRG
ncbi:hypothetical protein MHU86_11897 [Fragilaria crotonensis]|nr:hypothetical protein MHU86_11897 [Fragilaria crotonensis]